MVKKTEGNIAANCTIPFKRARPELSYKVVLTEPVTDISIHTECWLWPCNAIHHIRYSQVNLLLIKKIFWALFCMTRNSSGSHSQTGYLFTGVLGFVFGVRYPNDVHMPCLSLWWERGRRFLLSYHLLYTARQKRERLHSGVDVWHHNSKNSPKLVSVSHTLLWEALR